MEYTSDEYLNGMIDEHIIYGYKRKWQCNINIVNKQIRVMDWDGFKELPTYYTRNGLGHGPFIYEFYKGTYYLDFGDRMQRFKKDNNDCGLVRLYDRMGEIVPFAYNRMHLIRKGFDGKFNFHPCV